MFDNDFCKMNRFSNFFRQLIRKKILYVYITKISDLTSNILLLYLVKDLTLNFKH